MKLVPEACSASAAEDFRHSYAGKFDRLTVKNGVYIISRVN